MYHAALYRRAIKRSLDETRCDIHQFEITAIPTTVELVKRFLKARDDGGEQITPWALTKILKQYIHLAIDLLQLGGFFAPPSPNYCYSPPSSKECTPPTTPRPRQEENVRHFDLEKDLLPALNDDNK
jgi:hypothetical protein